MPQWLLHIAKQEKETEEGIDREREREGFCACRRGIKVFTHTQSPYGSLHLHACT